MHSECIQWLSIAVRNTSEARSLNSLVIKYMLTFVVGFVGWFADALGPANMLAFVVGSLLENTLRDCGGFLDWATPEFLSASICSYTPSLMVVPSCLRINGADGWVIPSINAGMAATTAVAYSSWINSSGNLSLITPTTSMNSSSSRERPSMIVSSMFHILATVFSLLLKDSRMFSNLAIMFSNTMTCCDLDLPVVSFIWAMMEFLPT